MLNLDEKSPSDVLMAALAVVEKATRVIIIIENEDHITIKTSCHTYQETKWALDQATHAVMNELFGVDAKGG
jgi:hypothetical protein